MKRRSLIQLMGGLALPATGAYAQQIGGGRPIRIVLPLAAGTGADTFTRMIQPKLSEALGQTIVVENKPGGSGIIGVQDVLRAAPDGTTLLLASVSVLAINVALVKNLPYDPRKDFTPIAGAYNANHVWMVNNNFPARNMAELVAYAKKNPGKIRAGHATPLIKIQLAALEELAGIEFLDVPYKVNSTAYQDLLGGTIDLFLMDSNAALGAVKQGQVRALAVSTPKRNPLTPDWPAVSETIAGYGVSSWSAMAGPPGMPPAVVARLNSAMATVLKQPDIVTRMGGAGMTPLVLSPAELKAFIDSEVTKFVRLAKVAKLEPE